MRPLVVITVLVLSIVGCAERPWHGIVRSPADPAPALVLAGAADLPGTRIRLDSLRGEVVVLYFGYTHCPDVCPTTLADWARAKRALGADTTGIHWLFAGYARRSAWVCAAVRSRLHRDGADRCGARAAAERLGDRRLS
jgi:protein SCO1/2